MHTTLQKYLRSLEPILLEDEARGGTDFRTAYAARVKLVEDFEHGLGPTCQERLQGQYLMTPMAYRSPYLSLS